MSDLQPKSVVTEGHKRRRLTKPFSLTWEYGDQEYYVMVPADGQGYEVSAPRPLRALAALFAPYYSLEDVSAAHNYLYRMRDVHGRPRAEADAVLFADDSDPAWLQWAAWLYVRAVGWVAWYDYDDAIKDKLTW